MRCAPVGSPPVLEIGARPAQIGESRSPELDSAARTVVGTLNPKGITQRGPGFPRAKPRFQSPSKKGHRMSDLMIEVEDLRKNYGVTRAVNKVSFSVRRGEVLGFLGPNGAGKSTTMKILTCYLAHTAGRVVVAGHDVFSDSLEVRKRVGYLPEDTPIYRDMTVREFLQFAAEMRGMDRAKSEGRIREIGSRCGLGDVAGKLVGELSK